ncbi:hypothetical protein C4D60_Mb05t09190 [Musa balbisiana]|uniref:Uncharacterized protein n=1 Tax=Musa balbisiana TaxID=52838 RepID=A0A4S8JUT7_MUSBA|nr:hypothetical protein C4D60_Mb05t09190 [Musa balbisiana]
MAFCSCFGPSKAERREADRAESEEARAKATEAAQRRQLLYLNLPPLPPSFSRSKLRRQTVLQEQFDKSAAGRAAKAQMAALAKQSSVSNKGEPVLKVSSLSQQIH